MSRLLRVVVADDEPIMLMYLQETLEELGHHVVGQANEGKMLVDLCREFHPDLVVTDVRMPELDGFRAARLVCHEDAIPFVFLTGYDEWVRATEVERECVLIYLAKPVGKEDLQAAIDVVMQRYEQFHMLLREDPDIRRTLSDRQYVEKAKALFVRWKGISDRQAFDQLRDLAEERHLKVVEAARSIIGE
ncbi:MAG: response regulator [FCB group bacterium]|jgi:response regulator NasT|nr:response regulator [FCB group bacterium]